MATNHIDICHINIRSLSDLKMDALKAEIAQLDYDIICLTETNLPHARVENINLPGFQHLISKDRPLRQGGGVAAFVADYIGAVRLSELEVPELELMWIKIKAGTNTLLIGTCYLPPNSKNEFWVKLKDSLDLAKQSGFKDILLSGDFNADPQTR